MNLDDSWQERKRSSEGMWIPNGEKFPNGIKPLVDLAHFYKLKFGIYSDAAK